MNAPDLTRRIQYFSSKSVPLATELVAQPHMAAATWVDMVAERDSLRADNARLREALHGAMFFVPLGTKARERADSALDSAALAHKGE